MTQHAGFSMNRLSGGELRPKVLLDNRDIFFTDLVEELNYPRTKTFENRGLTVFEEVKKTGHKAQEVRVLIKSY